MSTAKDAARRFADIARRVGVTLALDETLAAVTQAVERCSASVPRW